MGVTDSERARDRGVYTISVAAELSGIEPHTLRSYERAGLLTPARSHGGDRRYSDDDLSRLRHISSMALQGLNLAGIRRVLELEAENRWLQAEIETLRGSARIEHD
jgi:DNA-binding transcriptional MerR regulator